MTDREPQDREPLEDAVARRARRRKAAKRRRGRSAWFGLGMFGLVGWSVAIPALIGTAVGLWLDGRTGGERSWTLTFLLVGVAVGCANAWYWIRQESEDD